MKTVKMLRKGTFVFLILLVSAGLVGCPLLNNPDDDDDDDPPDNRVTVPDVVGKTQSAAEDAITSRGLKVGAKTEKHSDTVEAGRVISQNPTAGSRVQPGSAVALTVSLGPDNIIGPEGGEIEEETGAAVEVPVNGITEEAKFEVEETPDEQVRENLDESVPYAGSVTLDASAADPGKAEVAYIDARNCNMTVWVPLNSSLAAGTELDVYLKGELPGEWILLDVKAIVEASGQRASFQTNRIGTFLVRVPDDHSVLTINYDEVEKDLWPWPDPDYQPALGYGLHRLPAYGEAYATGDIPIILFQLAVKVS
jgi:hypothetical protein